MTQPSLGPIQPPIQWVPGSFLGGKAADVKCERSCTFTPPIRYNLLGTEFPRAVFGQQRNCPKVNVFCVMSAWKIPFCGITMFDNKIPLI